VQNSSTPSNSIPEAAVIVDFGQNMAGRLSLSLSLPSTEQCQQRVADGINDSGHATLRILHSELLHSNGSLNTVTLGEPPFLSPLVYDVTSLIPQALQLLQMFCCCQLVTQKCALARTRFILSRNSLITAFAMPAFPSCGGCPRNSFVKIFWREKL
jgi:hypothetical protein